MYRYIIHYIFRQNMIQQNLKTKKVFSYSQFLIKNPKAIRKEKQDAVKKFLDSTR